MAIVRNATTSSSGNSDIFDYTFSWNHTCSALNNRVLIVLVSWFGSSSISGVTYGGAGMTSVISRTNGNYKSAIYRLINPASGSNAVVITMSAGLVNIVAGAYDFYNVHQTTPIDNSAGWTGTINGSGGSNTTNIVTSTENCYIIDVIVCEPSGTTMVGTETERWDTASTQVKGASSDAGIFAGPGTKGMTWTNNGFSAATVAHCIVALRDIGVKTVTCTSKARIKRINITKTVTAKARVCYVTYENIIQAKGEINLIGVPTLVSPSQVDIFDSPATLVWLIPWDYKGRNVHSWIQIDKTDDMFADLEKNINSYQDAGFEYWDGDSWEPYPVEGVGSAYYGNQARVNVSLTDGVKYWRARATVG